MCLKYFIEQTTCGHHEYVGSQHCSDTPCDLGTQHFHYIRDGFPIPLPLNLQQSSAFGPGALTCTTCAKKRYNEIDPDVVPVKHYLPTNDFKVEETRPTGYALPIEVVKTQTVTVEDKKCAYDYDYKSLSDAGEEEWDTTNEQIHSDVDSNVDGDELAAQTQRAFMQQQVARQLSNLPNHLAQHRQSSSFAPSGYTPEAYAMGSYMHYPMPHVFYQVPPAMFSMSLWRGGLAAFSSVQTTALPPHPSTRPRAPMAPPLIGYAVKSMTTSTLGERPATPPPTPPMHPLPPRPVPPYIVGSLTDAYLRMEAARRRHVRKRARRVKSSLRDALPTRSMSLAEYVVESRGRKGKQKASTDIAEDVGVDTWLSVPFAGGEADTDGGAGEFAGRLRSEMESCRFSCRLVTLM